MTKPEDRRLLGYWLPFVGFRDMDLPQHLPEIAGLKPNKRPAFVVQWFGVTALTVFFHRTNQTRS